MKRERRMEDCEWLGGQRSEIRSQISAITGPWEAGNGRCFRKFLRFCSADGADAGLLRFWRRREKRAQLLVEIAQGRTMKEECIINLRETLHQGAVRGKFVATFDEGADDIEVDSRSPERSPASHAGIAVYPTASPHVVFILIAWELLRTLPP